MSIINELLNQLQDDWTSKEAPRFVKRVGVALFAAQAAILVGGATVTIYEAARAVTHYSSSLSHSYHG